MAPAKYSILKFKLSIDFFLKFLHQHLAAFPEQHAR
jgi:hypothetical protein